MANRPIDGLMHGGGPMWGMGLVGSLVIVAPPRDISALAESLFYDSRRSREDD